MQKRSVSSFISQHLLNLEENRSSGSETRMDFYGSMFMGLAIFISTLSYIDVLDQLFKIHIWRHDALYYLESYSIKLRTEGRWLIHLLFPYLKLIPGWLAASLSLLFFQGFCFVLAYKITRNMAYAILTSFLCIQMYPIYNQILWPPVACPSFLILFIASLVVNRLSPMVFYPLFGILLLGGMANLYFVLPLLHFPVIVNGSLKQNIVCYLNIMSLWIFGFVLGYGTSLVFVYTITGRFGIEIADWRRPNPVHSLSDLLVNIKSTIGCLTMHTRDAFPGPGRVAVFIIPAVLGLSSRSRKHYLLLLLIIVPVILGYYAATIPIGIFIATRTIVAAWMGALASFFLPATKRWQIWVMAPIICFLSFSFSQRNENGLRQYGEITNTWHDELLAASPLPPFMYKGLVMLSSEDEFRSVTRSIERNLGIPPASFEGLRQHYRWSASASEAGFKITVLCGNSNSYYCRKLRAIEFNQSVTPHDGLYIVLGQTKDKMLLLRWNTEFAGGER